MKQLLYLKNSILLFILCLFTYQVYAADIDFNKRYTTTSWQVDTKKGVNPYNTSSGQVDYINTSKYYVAGTRDVTSRGSTFKQTAVAQVSTTASEIKNTIANRVKNLGKYTKGLGKATAGGFLGSAALTALIEGIGWVMDEGGKVTMRPDPSVVIPQHEQYRWSYTDHSTNPISVKYAFKPEVACDLHIKSYGRSSWFLQSWSLTNSTTAACKFQNGTDTVNRVSNPIYNPSYVPDRVQLNEDQIADGVREALESNNPALGAAIAAAVKEAFKESQLDKDPDTGEIYTPLPKKAADALDQVGDAQVDEELDPTVCVPNVGDLQGNCTSMPKSEADKIPTLKCEMRPIISANSCVYVVDPDAPPKSTIDKPQIGEDGSLPDSCSWFDFLCKFTDWMQDTDFEETDTKPEITEIKPPDVNPNLLNVVGTCPADFVYQMNFFGHTGEIRWSYSYACDFFSSMSPWVKLLCSFASLKIIRGRSGG